MQQHEFQDTNLRDIFLSHRSIDKSVVWELAADIESHVWQGRSLMTWVDEAEIRPGQSVVGMVNDGLERSRFIGLVMTPVYFQSTSGWTDAEWHAALHSDPDNRYAKVLPLLVQDCPYIPYLLRHLKAIDFRGNRWQRGMEELLAVLRDEPLPRPITHRGQLIQPGGRIDRTTLFAERAVPEADPDAVPEKLYCNLLPVDALPHYVYIAPIAKALRRLKANGAEALPTKRQLMEVIRAQQLEGGVEPRFMPAFRVVGDEVISFHDMESSDNPLAGIVESDSGDDVPVKVSVKDFIHEEENRRIVISLLNMSITRHCQGAGLLIDETKSNRFFFPPKNNGPHVVTWQPLKKKTQRTVAKPLTPDDPKSSWIHQSAYIKAVFLASRFYIQIIPTRVITEDGYRIKGGPTVGRVVIKWIGRERNMQVLYHVRFWTSILRRGRRGPISIRAGDQRLDVATTPAFIQQAYGIRDDQMNLMELLDQEAPLIAEAEETALEVQTEIEDLDGWESSGEEQLFEDECDEDSDNDES